MAEISSFPLASEAINDRMARVMGIVNGDFVLKEGLLQLHYLDGYGDVWMRMLLEESIRLHYLVEFLCFSANNLSGYCLINKNIYCDINTFNQALQDK